MTEQHSPAKRPSMSAIGAVLLVIGVGMTTEDVQCTAHGPKGFEQSFWGRESETIPLGWKTGAAELVGWGIAVLGAGLFATGVVSQRRPNG